MKFTVIRSNDLTPEHLSVWSGIQEANPALASPYFRPEFAMAAASVRDDVFIAVLEEGGKVVGFFPYQRRRFRIGKPVGGPLSDHHGVIARIDADWRGDELIRACGLSAWDFDHLIASQLPFQRYHTSRAKSPFMDLSRGFHAYATERIQAGSCVVTETRRKERKLEREVGRISFELDCSDDGVLRTLMRWKSGQYASSGLVDIFQFEWIVQFLQRLLVIKGEGFAGILSVLRAGDQIAAAHMGMRSRTVWHWWFPSYNRCLGQYSPGSILLMKMAEAAPSLGIRAIDLGKGDSLYKQRLTSGAVEVAEGSVEASCVTSMARRIRRGVEAWVRGSALAPVARIPGRLLRRVERRFRFQ